MTKRTFFCSHPADETGTLSYDPDYHNGDGVFSIEIDAVFDMVDLSIEDRIAFASDLLTVSKDHITDGMAAGIYEELTGMSVGENDRRVEMDNPEVVYNGFGWQLLFAPDCGWGNDNGFVRIENDAGNGGAFVSPERMMEMAEAIIDRFAYDDDMVIALAQRLIDERTETPEPKIPGGYMALSSQAQKVLQYMRRAGSISARDAMADLDMTSATLSRRICDIEEEGFRIKRERRIHQVTGKRYTRYSLAD